MKKITVRLEDEVHEAIMAKCERFGDYQHFIGQALRKSFCSTKAVTKKAASTSMLKPSREDIAEYCLERGGLIDGERFYDYCEANGWKLSNGNKMKDWKASIRTWEGRKRDKQEQQNGKQSLSERSAAATASLLANCENVGDLLGSDDPFIRSQVGFEGGDVSG